MKNIKDKIKKGLAVANASDADRLASRNVNFFPGIPTARKDYALAATGLETDKTPKYLRSTGQKSRKSERDGLTVWLLGMLAMNRIYKDHHSPAPKNEIS